MEVLEGIFSVAKSIYDLCDQASCNKKQCKRLRMRIEILMVPVEKIQKYPEKHNSKDILQLLQEMLVNLQNAAHWISKYTRLGWWRKILLANSIREEFVQFNDRMGDSAQGLSIVLQVEQQLMFLEAFQEQQFYRQNEKDAKADLQELKKLLQSGNELVVDCVDNMNENMKEIRKMYESLAKLGVTEIRTEDLFFKEELKETPSSIMYKGEYLKGTVAIKRFKYPLNSDTREVRKIFEREAKVMNKFSYANILRLYGICIDNTGDRPSYSIVMEYCAKGTLREVLRKEEELSWETRIDMCVGAARALYRLHHTVSKPVVHQRIDTTKFLVDGCYCVKLAGFELTQTESSMNRNSGTISQDESFLAFCCPQRLASINYPYDKKCDIYRFGIVLWEIVTGKIPFEGCTALEIYRKVCEERFQEALPSNCPVELKGLIDLCRAYDPSQRPNAGVVADTLAAFQNKMEL